LEIWRPHGDSNPVLGFFRFHLIADNQRDAKLLISRNFKDDTFAGVNYAQIMLYRKVSGLSLILESEGE